jgi:dipeptidase E
MGDATDRLLALLDGKRRAAVIANAIDHAPPDIRMAGVDREVTALAELGIEARELDLRSLFGRPKEARRSLSRYDLLWLRGGNVFMLRHALARSHADVAIGELLREDEIVYGGYSAGPCVLAPSLRGLETVDDPKAVTDIYGESVVWEGLDILSYAIVPHVDSPGHPETVDLGLVARRYRDAGVPHKTLRDGEVLVIDGAEVDIVPART